MKLHKMKLPQLRILQRDLQVDQKTEQITGLLNTHQPPSWGIWPEVYTALEDRDRRVVAIITHPNSFNYMIDPSVVDWVGPWTLKAWGAFIFLDDDVPENQAIVFTTALDSDKISLVSVVSHPVTLLRA